MAQAVGASVSVAFVRKTPRSLDISAGRMCNACCVLGYVTRRGVRDMVLPRRSGWRGRRHAISTRTHKRTRCGRRGHHPHHQRQLPADHPTDGPSLPDHGNESTQHRHQRGRGPSPTSSWSSAAGSAPFIPEDLPPDSSKDHTNAAAGGYHPARARNASIVRPASHSYAITAGVLSSGRHQTMGRLGADRDSDIKSPGNFRRVCLAGSEMR